MLVLACGIVFSFGGLFFRATEGVDAWQYLTLRGAGAALVVGPVLAWQNRGEFAAIGRRLPWQHTVAGLVLGAMMVSFIVSLTHTDVAFVLLFQALAPIAAAIFSWLLLRERLEWQAAVAAAGSIIGVVIMVSSGLDAGIGWAILIVAVIPVGLGLYSTLIRAGASGDPLVPVLIAGVICALAGAVVSLADEGLSFSGRDFTIGILAGVLLIGVPVPFFNWAQKTVPAPDASLLLMSEIVLGPVWVWWAYDEAPSGATLAGGAIILLLVLWLTSQAPPDERDLHTTRG